MALGVALQARGHRATVITNPIFQAQIEAQGLRFLGVGTAEDARRIIANPDLWHVRKSVGLLSQVLLPSLQQMFRVIEAHADQDTVLAFSTLALGARLAQEKLKVPGASVHLQPAIFRSLDEQGMFANLRLSAAYPRWLKSMVFRLADVLVLDRYLKEPINEFRRKLGLAPVERLMHRWLHSPQLVLGLFPEWFAAPQRDWPPNTHLVGFPLWDSDPTVKLDEALEFLDSGAPPIIFTPGSAGATMHDFFRESVQAARQVGMRAMLVTNYPEQLPAQLPTGIKAFGYLPFSEVLPRAALLVYHGGIGTLAQGIKAGVPHLVVPHAHDQFDNAWRLEQLGLGRSVPIGVYRASRAARAMRSALSSNGALQQRRLEFSRRIESQEALDRAVRLLEELHAG